ncbi:hypothetical protein BJX64DRAFT_258899 [Aspergillus heterothallicus]
MPCSTPSPAKAIMSSLRHDGRGFTHLATDGVLRSFDGDRKVIDYRQLSPEEIQIVLQVFPAQLREQVEHKLVGVDGRNVTDEGQLWNPGEDILGEINKKKKRETDGVEAPSSTPVG